MCAIQSRNETNGLYSDRTPRPDPKTAAALRGFLLWAIAPDETNEKFLAEAHFIPLPAHIWVLSHDQIESVR